MKGITLRNRIAAFFCLALFLCFSFVTSVYAGDTEDEAAEESEEQAEELQTIVRDIRSTDSVKKYGMTPVSGEYVADGIYPIEAKSNSAYFHIEKAELAAEGGVLSARFTIPSMSYLYVYMGTKKEAADADEADWIIGEEENGCTVFTVPVKALNEEIDCSAFSRRRKKWYDRKIIFYADSLPKDALSIELPDYDLIERSILYYGSGEGAEAFAFEESSDAQTPDEDPDALILCDEKGDPLPAEMDLPDGEYSIEVNMTGGSGRASVSSPAGLTVKDGGAYAKLLWSSSYYDYLILGGKTYYNQTTDGGNSTFLIPVPIMNESFPIVADTTAMGEPVEIRYMLTFYEDTIGDRGRIPQVAAGRVLIIAVVILGAGGVLNLLVKRRRK